ncbi:hypothetical protein [Bradyrhizobium viridifuturi]|uniref:hypothetical protein n=1 Tax=Bradyrhizobium viridifuturi TaxID=1654716 RepID=UPI000A4D0139|nr:hypothetical protein [Bradyrhizobium viridifuturi]
MAALFACAGWTLPLASTAAGEVPSPFADPPGYHRPVTPPAPGPADAKPAVGQQAHARPWVQLPSPQLAARLQGWRVTFVPDKSVPDPAKGVFASFSYLSNDSTVRLLKGGLPTPVKLTPVAWRKRFIPKSESRTDPNDQVMTQELVAVLSEREIAQFITSQRLGSPRLVVGQNLAVALVQEFDAALRTPGHKEHIWSINWRVETNPGKTDDYVGYEAWGLFTRVNGALKPFHLAARESSSSGENSDYFYLLATGDLDGDGIDEMVVREMIFEAEEDYVQLWAWERGIPVAVSKIPGPRRN